MRPHWLPRRADFTPTRLEMDSDIPPDASRTFAPPKRRLCVACAGTWAFALVSAIATACAVVHVAARAFL